MSVCPQYFIQTMCHSLLRFRLPNGRVFCMEITDFFQPNVTTLNLHISNIVKTCFQLKLDGPTSNRSSQRCLFDYNILLHNLRAPIYIIQFNFVCELCSECGSWTWVENAHFCFFRTSCWYQTKTKHFLIWVSHATCVVSSKTTCFM